MISTNAQFAEIANIITGVPLDMAGTPGLATGWISLKNYERATVVLIRAASAAAEGGTLTLQQASAVAGTGAKNLVAIDRVNKKEHASALSGIGTWTEVTQAAAATFALTAQVQAIYAVDIDPTDLDDANGFDCFQATTADTGTTADFGVLFVILWGARYAPPLSPLAD